MDAKINIGSDFGGKHSWDRLYQQKPNLCSDVLHSDLVACCTAL